MFRAGERIGQGSCLEWVGELVTFRVYRGWESWSHFEFRVGGRSGHVSSLGWVGDLVTCRV